MMRVGGGGSRVAGLLFLCLFGAHVPLRAQSPTRDSRPATRVEILDSFEHLEGWTAHPSGGVTLKISSDPAGAHGRSMRLDFDFHGGGGYAIARKRFDVPLPANYAFTFRVRGAARPQNLEFKLIDSTGENVWWSNQRDFVFPRDWTTVTRKRRHITFAWGPIGGGELHRVATVEFVITAGQGGRGTVWLDDFAMTPLERVATGPMPRPTASASSSAPGHAAPLAADGDSGTIWRSASVRGTQSLSLDLGGQREFGGLTIDWAPGEQASDYAIDVSSDGTRWDEVRRVVGGDGGHDMVDVPEGEARLLRIRMLRPAGRSYAIRDATVMPLAWSATPNDFARSVAREARRGTYPRYLTDSVQVYWTLVGTSGDRHEGLLGDDGALESGRGGYSVEPFLRAGGALVGWADVERRPSLEDGSLPIPSVTWTPRDSAALPVTLTVTAFATGSADVSTLGARYRITNRGTSSRAATLYLAIRPFQVNPPWQFLNAPGGVSRIRSIRWDGRAVLVDSARPVVPVTTPTAFGASSLDRGEIVESLRRGTLPGARSIVDEQGRASGALAYAMSLAPGESREVWIALPPTSGLRAPTASAGATAFDAARRSWREQLSRVTVELPDAGAPRGSDVAATLRSTLAYILINRNGPAIQPGSRSYSRSWIRDGALTSAALLRLGHAAEVKQFIEWFAPYQYPNGKVPCCVDARGADPVPENDSHGEFIYLVAEYYRYTGDRALLERMWPHVAAAAAYMDTLRRQRMTPEFTTPEKRVFYGLLPESISHEGYSAKPMHSYWDDFFALKGYKDATDLAAVLGREADRARLAASRDEFRRDLYASLNTVISTRAIAYVPGSAELADFDATSTTTAIEPGGELANLPQPALAQGFDRYFRGVMARRDSVWEGYTPYELRTVGTFVRMGRRARALAVLADLMKDRRPPEWNQWAEVVFRDPSTPRFVGDMPHTWVGSDFIRSALDMFAYDREADSALVVGAGVQEAWASTAPGVVVRGLHTAFGTLDVTVRSEGAASRVTLGGAMRTPPGGFVVRSPRTGTPRTVTVNGAPAAARPGGETCEVVVRRLPAVVEFSY